MYVCVQCARAVDPTLLNDQLIELQLDCGFFNNFLFHTALCDKSVRKKNETYTGNEGFLAHMAPFSSFILAKQINVGKTKKAKAEPMDKNMYPSQPTNRLTKTESKQTSHP
jgi:hypothetical protein